MSLPLSKLISHDNDYDDDNYDYFFMCIHPFILFVLSCRTTGALIDDYLSYYADLFLKKHD